MPIDDLDDNFVDLDQMRRIRRLRFTGETGERAKVDFQFVLIGLAAVALIGYFGYRAGS